MSSSLSTTSNLVTLSLGPGASATAESGIQLSHVDEVGANEEYVADMGAVGTGEGDGDGDGGDGGDDYDYFDGGGYDDAGE